jgi:hypothetical protein
LRLVPLTTHAMLAYMNELTHAQRNKTPVVPVRLHDVSNYALFWLWSSVLSLSLSLSRLHALVQQHQKVCSRQKRTATHTQVVLGVVRDSLFTTWSSLALLVAVNGGLTALFLLFFPLFRDESSTPMVRYIIMRSSRRVATFWQIYSLSLCIKGTP